MEPFALQAVPSLAHTLSIAEQADALLITGQLQQPSLPCFVPRCSKHTGSAGAAGALGWLHCGAPRGFPGATHHKHSMVPGTATSCCALTLGHGTFWGRQTPQQSHFHQTRSCFSQCHQSE